MDGVQNPGTHIVALKKHEVHCLLKPSRSEPPNSFTGSISAPELVHTTSPNSTRDSDVNSGLFQQSRPKLNEEGQPCMPFL